MVEAPLIDVESLVFGWPSHAPCLSIDRFRVDAGERVFLFGPSGSGKSTLLALLGAVLLPQQGRIRMLGTDLSTLRSGERDRFRVEHIGFIFQQFNLVPYLSVVQNVLLPCRFSEKRAARASKVHGTPEKAAHVMLAAMGLDAALQRRKVTELSVGQQQRVAAARSLIGSPDLLVADEPTSSLDADTQEAFLAILLRECEEWKSTLLFVSHDRRLSARFDREVDLPAINRVWTGTAQ